MGLFSWIGEIFSPAAKLVDDLNTSEEEKLTLRNELAQIQSRANEKLIELEQAKTEALSRVQEAEAKSSNLLQSSWRPVCSLSIVAIIILGSFGKVSVGPEIYELAQVFLGTYGVGRSFEKITSRIKG